MFFFHREALQGQPRQSFCLGKIRGFTKTPQIREITVFCEFPFVRDKFLRRGFCTSETRIRARILLNEFWTPELWTRILGSNLLVLFSRKGPLKTHCREIHLPKFTFQNSTQKSGQKIHIAPLQGHLADPLFFFCAPEGNFLRIHKSRKPVRESALFGWVWGNDS